MRFLQDRLRLGPGISVIELGGGGGSFLLPFARLGCTCYALDFSEVGLQRARRLFAEQGYELHTIVGDLLQVSSTLKGHFDVAVSYGLCEHFQGADRFAIIKAHRELIKPMGATLLSVPNAWSPFYQLWWRTARTLTRMGLASRLDVNVIDEWAFSPWELSRLCDRAELDNTIVVGTPILGDAVDMLARPAWKFAVRLVGRGYQRSARLHAPRSMLDDTFGSYLFAVGSAR